MYEVIHTCAYIYIHMDVHECLLCLFDTCIYLYVYIYMYVYMCIYIHMCIYIYTIKHPKTKRGILL